MNPTPFLRPRPCALAAATLAPACGSASAALGNPPGLEASLNPVDCFATGCFVNPGPFEFNPRPRTYWSGTSTPDGYAFAFDFDRGGLVAVGAHASRRPGASSSAERSFS